MRIPFAIWSAVLALIVYGAMIALGYRNFGVIDPIWDRAVLIGAVWLALVVIVGVWSMLRKAMTARPAHLPDDVARELDAHSEAD